MLSAQTFCSSCSSLSSQRFLNAGFRRKLPWLGIACILIFFAAAVVRLHPTNFFGLSEDDSIYFSSAKALAQGKGYILPYFPGTPPATKYPILYPWILSWVWHWNPSFPANLTDAIAVSVAFGMAFVTITFFFLRRMKGLSEAEALVLTAFCALHPVTVYLSGSLLSEVPFAAFALGAMLLADTATKPDAGIVPSVWCSILTGLAMLTRVFGVPVAAGILFAAIVRRAWRQLFVFLVCMAPFGVALASQAIFPRLPVSPVSGAAATSLGWIHAWTYYTSYIAAWRIAVPNAQIFWAMVRNNGLTLLKAPAYFFLFPTFVRNTMAGRAVVLVVTAATLGGIRRQGLRGGWKPVHFVLPAYMVVMLFWNYASGDRFLIPFLPLFAAGIWFELKNILSIVRKTIVATQTVTEKFLAASFGLMIAIFICAVALNYVGGMRKIVAEKSQERAARWEEKRGAYEWLSRFTNSATRVVAYEDVSLYLSTDRLAMRPIIFTTAEFYEPSRLGTSLEHITDVPRAIGAEYWVFSDEDFSFEWPEAHAKGHSRIDELEQVLPIVYRSRYGHVRVRYLGCVQHPETLSCRSAVPILFPQRDKPKPIETVSH
jgi:hypothetical protein